MSHLATVRTQVRDAVAVTAACQRLNWPLPANGTAQLYSGAATGLVVTIPSWRYPAVIELSTGDIHFDHFEGAWGDPQLLHRFLQRYAVEKACIEARRQGHRVNEQALADGSIRLQITTGG